MHPHIPKVPFLELSKHLAVHITSIVYLAHLPHYINRHDKCVLRLEKTPFLNPRCGIRTPTAAALRRAARCMKEAGQSPRDLRLPIGEKPRSTSCQDVGMRRSSGAEVSSTKRRSPRLNLRRPTRVGAWNVMALSEVLDKRTCQRDCHLPQLSAELRRLGVSVAALSEVRRPGSG